MAAKEKLLHTVAIQSTYWHDRVRVKWLRDGDKCSNLFHTCVKVKCAKTKLSSLVIQGALCDNMEEISVRINYL